MVKEIIISVITTYGIGAVGFAAKQGFNYLRNKLGTKKYTELVNDCRTAVSALWDANKVLGLDKVEEIAIQQVAGKHKNVELIQQAVKKVISEMDSMADETTQQPTDQAVQPATK